jgi:tRNA/tmRNA/rRNA uracil-C5-methylase (TrmA/RlmC/RlmD family)
MGIKRVVYVSCGPETLVRDLKIFKDFGYEIKNVKCVDMFSKTEHVESVCLLSKVEK